MTINPDLLKDFYCFRDLAEEQINEIAKFAEAVCYQPGHTLFHEGEDANRLFLLLKGDVDVFYTLGEALLTHIETVSAEEIFGCSALVKPYKYTSTNKCLSEVQVLEVDVAILHQLMKKDCQTGLKIQQHIIESLIGNILDLRLLILTSK